MAKSEQYGAFVPTNYVWDIQQIQTVDFNTPEFRELLVRLYQNINNIALQLNIKDVGMYQVTEFVNGQLWFPNPNNTSSTAAKPALRQDLRKVINFGALPNNATKAVAHNITVTAATTWTRIYATATNPTAPAGITFGYNPAADITLLVDGTNVSVVTTANYSAYTTTYVVLEYLQS